MFLCPSQPAEYDWLLGSGGGAWTAGPAEVKWGYDPGEPVLDEMRVPFS